METGISQQDQQFDLKPRPLVDTLAKLLDPFASIAGANQRPAVES